MDDDSPDGASQFARELAQTDRRIRVVKRVGRRGLSSACIEGVLSSCGTYVAIMDGDMQHDETVVPILMKKIKDCKLDVVMASRFCAGSKEQGLSHRRKIVSQWAVIFANFLLKQPLTDPMTGFFMLKRSVFDASLPYLSPMGFKILLDILISHPDKSLKIEEIPFSFRNRHAGNSKLDTLVIWEYILFLLEKLFYRQIPAAFLSFSIIGTIGLLFHFTLLKLFLMGGVTFLNGHICATILTIGFNFSLNNLLTYRSSRLRGVKAIYGLLSFYIICGVGAVSNIGVAAFLFRSNDSQWFLAAIVGISIGAFWNFGMSRFVTWGNH